MSGNLRRLPARPPAGHRLVRRHLFTESAKLIEEASGHLRKLEERLWASDDFGSLDFTALADVRAQSASLASAARHLDRRPFGRPGKTGRNMKGGNDAQSQL